MKKAFGRRADRALAGRLLAAEAAGAPVQRVVAVVRFSGRVCFINQLSVVTGHLLQHGNRSRIGRMTVEQIQRMHRARPFHPFDIHLADGRVLPVDHPELLAVPPPGRTIGVGCMDGTIEIVDLLLVISLKPRANGAPRSKRSRPQ